jgi:hypothetical protein
MASQIQTQRQVGRHLAARAASVRAVAGRALNAVAPEWERTNDQTDAIRAQVLRQRRSKTS